MTSGPARQAPPRRWADLLDAYSEHCAAAGHSRGTIEVRRSWLLRIARANPDPAAVTLANLEAFLAWAKWSPETRRAGRAAARSFFAWAADRGHLPADPAAKLSSIPIPVTAPRPAPEQVVAVALEDADPRVRLALLLAYLAGLRRAEIAGLRVTDVEDDRLVIRGKGGRVRVVPLHPDLASVLRPVVLAARQSGRRWIITTTCAGWHAKPSDRPITAAHLGRLVRGALGGHWTAHTLRHSAATNWYRSSHGDLFAVQQLLGHSKPETTSRYVAVASDSLRAAVAGTTLPRRR